MNSGWSLARRRHQAALLERWKPWQHTPGPKTDEGKAISSMNSFKHGARGAILRRYAAVLHQIELTLKLCSKRGGL